MVQQKGSNFKIDLPCNIKADVYTLEIWQKRVGNIYTVFILCLGLIKTFDSGVGYESCEEKTYNLEIAF